MFLRTGFSFLLYQNCAFDLLSYRNHLLVWLQLNWKLRALCHKKSSDLVFREKTRCFKIHRTENMFWLVDNEIGLLWALYHKKQRVCILVAKRRSTQLYSTKNMFWFVWRQTGLFAASGWPWFLFDCLQKNVLACLLLSYTVFSTIFLRTTFATFPHMK